MAPGHTLAASRGLAGEYRTDGVNANRVIGTYELGNELPVAEATFEVRVQLPVPSPLNLAFEVTSLVG